ncbi:MAG: response regulator transcription factor [Chthoniobacterales bacterium]
MHFKSIPDDVLRPVAEDNGETVQCAEGGRIKVLLADDHMIVRQGIRSLLEAEGDMDILSEAENGREAVEKALRLLPDVVLMDISMPLLNGLEAARQIMQALPHIHILILSGHDDDAYLEQALELGVAGFLVKQTSIRLLAKAVRTVVEGKSFFSPSICSRVARYEKMADVSAEATQCSCPLSSRETEVLQLIAEGMANKQTAAELGISVKTVEKHRQRLMDKLNVHDTAGLTRHAIIVGIIECNLQQTGVNKCSALHFPGG